MAKAIPCVHAWVVVRWRRRPCLTPCMVNKAWHQVLGRRSPGWETSWGEKPWVGEILGNRNPGGAEAAVEAAGARAAREAVVPLAQWQDGVAAQHAGQCWPLVPLQVHRVSTSWWRLCERPGLGSHGTVGDWQGWSKAGPRLVHGWPAGPCSSWQLAGRWARCRPAPSLTPSGRAQPAEGEGCAAGCRPRL